MRLRLLRALLHLYPASFRAEFGEELCAVFRQRRREASGLLEVCALWLATFTETLGNASAAHWDLLKQDLHYTARSLRRTPGFTLTAIAVSAIGIGATTAAFSLADHVLFRPLPFRDSERLVKLWEDQSPRNYADMEPSPANYRDWKRMSHSFEAMGAYHSESVNLVGVGEPLRLEGAAVTADLFPILDVQPALGRSFTEADDRFGAPGTLLLSDGLWQRRFGADPNVLGRKVSLDDAPFTIIGVMPPSFLFPSRKAELWTTTRFAADNFEDRGDNWLNVVAKLRRGVGLEQARAEMRVVGEQLARAWPKENEHVGVSISRLRDEINDRTRLLLIALLGAALCVLLIGCTNLANLLLARALVRRKELAVRTALGAGRERLVRQLLTESLVLAISGGAAGVLVATQAVPLLSKLVPNTLPIAEAPSIDLRVLGFAALLSCLTGIAFGVIPAMRACRGTNLAGLREGSRGGVGGRKELLRSVLVVAEVAGSVVLLVACGLLIRALWHLQSVDPGFRANGVLTMRTWLPLPKYDRTARREQFYTKVLSEACALPGVSGAAYASFLPMAFRGGIWKVAIAGRPPDEKFQMASLRYVTPGFFDILAIPLGAGRDVSESDTRDKPFVAVVSESFVRRYWPGQNPLGRHFDFGLADRTVVGVVGDVRVRGLERDSEPQVYLSYKQVPDGSIVGYIPKDLVVRISASPGAVLPSLRRIVASADPEQPISDVRMLSDIVEDDTAPRVVQVRVLGAFAAIAFLLAGIGIHGLLAFAVSSRAQEIGVRIALGARPYDIIGMVLGDGVRLAAAGVVLGTGLAYAAGRALEALLAGVKPGDLPTFATAVALCLLMTAFGSLLPAIRAVRVDPTTSIRAE